MPGKKGDTGAIGELLACAELLKRGYDAYRAQSPHAPFDLVAHRDGVLLRVEVKCLGPNRNLVVPAWPAPRNRHWDICIVILGEDRVVFVPNLDDPVAERSYYYAELGLPVPNSRAIGYVGAPQTDSEGS